MMEFILKSTLQIFIGFAVTWIPLAIVFKIGYTYEKRKIQRYLQKYGKLPPL